jgi:hypothetical protein
MLSSASIGSPLFFERLDIRDDAPRHAREPEGMTPLVEYDPLTGRTRPPRLLRLPRRGRPEPRGVGDAVRHPKDAMRSHEEVVGMRSRLIAALGY